MRVLVAHNFYRSISPSGENAAVLREVRLLRDAGVEVFEYFRHSDELDSFTSAGRIGLALTLRRRKDSIEAIRSIIRENGVNVVHLHNCFPLISPGVVEAATLEACPLVVTVHNYRFRCMNGLNFREGNLCFDCDRSGGSLHGVLHGCYRNSRLQSLPMVPALKAQSTAWQQVRRFIAVSDFVKEQMMAAGIDKNRIRVKPNHVGGGGDAKPNIGRGFLFAGRLSSEKGIEILLEGWRRAKLPLDFDLMIAGDGELRGLVEAKAIELGNIRLLGQLNHEDLVRARMETRAAIHSSTCLEAATSVGESFAVGRPVVATKFGATGTVADETVGWMYEPGSDQLARALNEAAWSSQDEVDRKSVNALAHWQRVYEPGPNVEQLVNIYASSLRADSTDV